jgi:hypothetical protein
MVRCGGWVYAAAHVVATSVGWLAEREAFAWYVITCRGMCVRACARYSGNACLWCVVQRYRSVITTQIQGGMRGQRSGCTTSPSISEVRSGPVVVWWHVCTYVVKRVAAVSEVRSGPVVVWWHVCTYVAKRVAAVTNVCSGPVVVWWHVCTYVAKRVACSQ